MTADVAMTKRGFGEMAITGCIAGPIFNVLVGLGLSMTISIIKTGKNPPFSLWAQNADGTKDFNKVTILPLTLCIGQIVILLMVLANGVANNYKVSFRWSLFSIIIYAVVITTLVVYSIIEKVQPPSG